MSIFGHIGLHTSLKHNDCIYFKMERTSAVIMGITFAVFSCFPMYSHSLDDVPEFQYPCFSDVCTFPSQFCNSKERRCTSCTRAVCQLPENSVPLACRYTCIKHEYSKYLLLIFLL